MKGTDTARFLLSGRGNRYAALLFLIVITLFLVSVSCSLLPRLSRDKPRVYGLMQPDQVYYSLDREKLLNTSAADMKKFPTAWIVAGAREGAPGYGDLLSTKPKFKAGFLQRFEVMEKQGDKVRVKEMQKKSNKKKRRRLRTGWMQMQDLIYLPRALRDRQTAVYQKVVFTHRAEHLETGDIPGVNFYKTPGSTKAENIHETKSMGTHRMAYVYAWENTCFEDSQFVLLGRAPSIYGVLTGENAYQNVIYGWCKTSNLFPWNSRTALIPNPKAEFPTYIFRNGGSLAEFYKSAAKYSVPDSRDLLTNDSLEIWQDSQWPFFPVERLTQDDREYLQLICQVAPRYSNINGITGEQLEKELEKLETRGKNLDVLFLVDATRNMGPYIESIARSIRAFMRELGKNKNIDTKHTRCGAAVFRDYVDGPRVFEMEPLSKNINRIKKRLNAWVRRAFGNRKDDGEAAWPEALFNGIVESVNQAGYGKYHTKFLIIIGDAGNHSRNKDSYTRRGIGELLADNNINCIMVKVNHPLTGGWAEKKAMDLFKADASGIRSSYVRAYLQRAYGYNFNYSEKDILELFILDEVNDPAVLRDRLLKKYSKKISGRIGLIKESYGKITGNKSISTGTGDNATAFPLPLPSKRDTYINPLVFEKLKARFDDNFSTIFEELKQSRANLMQKGYAKEFDPRSPDIPQFKQVYLYRKDEIVNMIQTLDKILTRLSTRKVSYLWKEAVETIYGEEYEPGKTFNYYAGKYDGFTYKNLSILFDKTQQQINEMQFHDFDDIQRQMSAAKEKLNMLIHHPANGRFFGPRDNPYIWLYEEEVP